MYEVACIAMLGGTLLVASIIDIGLHALWNGEKEKRESDLGLSYLILFYNLWKVGSQMWNVKGLLPSVVVYSSL